MRMKKNVITEVPTIPEIKKRPFSPGDNVHYEITHPYRECGTGIVVKDDGNPLDEHPFLVEVKSGARYWMNASDLWLVA